MHSCAPGRLAHPPAKDPSTILPTNTKSLSALVVLLLGPAPLSPLRARTRLPSLRARMRCGDRRRSTTCAGALLLHCRRLNVRELCMFQIEEQRSLKTGLQRMQ